MNGVEAISAERQRQIEKEGYSAEHDDEHCNGELADAAAAYAQHSAGREFAGDLWPWDAESYNPSDPLHDLVRAGALIAAEYDRLQRREQKI